MQLNRVKDVADLVSVKTALISVAEKTGLEQFVRELWTLIPDLTIYSTGGTFTLLERLAGDTGRVLPVSAYTGQPEMQGGLVKTLDFRIYLGLLSEQFNPDHQADLQRTGAIPFDMAVCSFYPFEETARDSSTSLEDLRTNIDIGGPTLLRASAKNFLRVLPVCLRDDYATVVGALRRGGGSTTLDFRLAMALKAFDYTARYEDSIARHLLRVAKNTDLPALYADRAVPAKQEVAE
jgi:phosphoribosylaminoimidazolecarboxamide formyltransferase / IMP cyclohydrolase